MNKWEGQDIIGRITRCTYSPRLDRNIGFANVPIEQSEPGMSLIVTTPAGDEKAVVVKVPWFPAQTEIQEVHR